MNRFLLGKNELHKKIIVRNEQGESREVLWWNARGQNVPQGKFDLAYYLRLNRFSGAGKAWCWNGLTPAKRSARSARPPCRSSVRIS